MDVISQSLQNAIGTGEIINIIYHGGSEPGASRFILPIKIEGNKVRARCYKSNKVKEFNLEKIELAASEQATYSGEKREPETLSEAATPFLDELKKLGWEIELSDLSLVLFKRFKNGARRKQASLGIYYNEPETNSFAGFNPRPWYVSGHGHSFKYLGKAILQFIEYAREQAPNKGNKGET